MRHRRVDRVRVGLAEAGELHRPRGRDARADYGGGLARGGAQLTKREGRHLDVQVDAVEQWAGDAASVALDQRRQAGAGVAGVAEMAAGAGVHGQVAMSPLRGRKSRPGYPEAPKTLGEHLRRARLDRGLLQRQLAVRIGCSQASLLNWETEKSEPEVRFLPAILAFLGYDPRPAPGGFGERLRHTHEARASRRGRSLGKPARTKRRCKGGTVAKRGGERLQMLKCYGRTGRHETAQTVLDLLDQARLSCRICCAPLVRLLFAERKIQRREAGTFRHWSSA